MLFLAWRAHIFTQQFFCLPLPFSLWLPCLLNPSPVFLLTVNLGFSPFVNPSSAFLLSPFFLRPFLPVAVFLVLPLICDLWIYPFLLSLLGRLNPSERVSHCGWEGSCLGERYHFPESSYLSFLDSSFSSFAFSSFRPFLQEKPIPGLVLRIKHGVLRMKHWLTRLSEGAVLSRHFCVNFACSVPSVWVFSPFLLGV